MPQRQEQSLQLAQLWVEMQMIEQKLNGRVIPLLQHLGGAEDNPELFEALEQCAQQIEQHFECFKLQASVISK